MATEPQQPQPGHHARVKAVARGQFDKWAQTYDRSLLSELVFQPSIRTCREEITRWQATRGGGSYTLLDVGCGTGNLLIDLLRDPAAERVIGLDYSPEMVRRLQEKIDRLGAAGSRLSAMQGDSEHLPCGDGDVDVITCCNSFHHYPHQAAVVREFARVLRPGGLLVLIDGFRDNVIGWLIFDGCVGVIEKHVHHAKWSELWEMITQAGFASLQQRKMNVLAPLLVNVARR